jgi:hypothetical protein
MEDVHNIRKTEFTLFSQVYLLKLKQRILLQPYDKTRIDKAHSLTGA